MNTSSSNGPKKTFVSKNGAFYTKNGSFLHLILVCTISFVYIVCTVLVRVSLVVTSALKSTDVILTSGNRSPHETDGTAGSVTYSIFVRFTSNFVHLHPLPPLQEKVMSRFSLIHFFPPKFQLDGNLPKSLTGREMQRKNG